MGDLNRTPLFDLHVELGARMVPFAGYEMPVSYPLGVMKEHLHCRAAAGLFDVSHMGQVLLQGPDVARAFETLVPVDVLGLPEGRQRYGLFLNGNGGIEDDLMFANRGDHLFVVVNAACKAADIARMTEALGPLGIAVTPVNDRALIALQGPEAGAVLEGLAPGTAQMRFMDVADVTFEGVACWVSRSGYTGEDGFEISVPVAQADSLARRLLADDRVEAIGLGARDSLRLEAGLCLYGHDITGDTRPMEAGLGWAIQRVRRPGGARAGGFPGADKVFLDVPDGPERLRVGLRPLGRAPMREGTALFATENDKTAIGTVTSGGFGPTVNGPVAMGYVTAGHATPGTTVYGEVRGKRLPADVVTLPFVPARFKR